MRRRVLLSALIFLLPTTAHAATWEQVHDRAIHRHDLEQSWGKEFGAL